MFKTSGKFRLFWIFSFPVTVCTLCDLKLKIKGVLMLLLNAVPPGNSLVAQSVSACSAGHPRSIPGSGRPPEEGDGDPL